jgi:hypothetical protein
MLRTADRVPSYRPTTRVIQLDIDAAGANLSVRQIFERPAVYLDHWAIRRIASTPAVAERFACAIQRRRGTWAISMLNLMEFITMTDERQAAQFEDLIDRILPHIFFLEFQAFTVIDNERALIERRTTRAPYGDPSLLAAFAETQPDTPRPFTAKGLVGAVVRQRARLAPGLESFKATIVERIGMLREQMQADKELKKRVRGSQESAIAQRTWFYVREFIGTLLVDRSKVIRPNDAMDLMHTVVPVAYCDFALFDSQWEHRVAVIRDRLLERNIPLKPAVVFSGKPGGLEQFLDRLESS